MTTEIHHDSFFEFLDKHDTSLPKKSNSITHNKSLFQIEEYRYAKTRKPVETTCGTLSFPSASAASFHLGKSTSSVSSAIKAKSKCGGYYWQYVKKQKEKL